MRSSRPSSIASDQTLVYDPNSRRMVPQANLLTLEHQIHAAAEKKPKKKKKSALNRAGSHLAKGTMGRAHGTAVDNGVPNEATMAAAASLRSYRADEQHRAVQEPEEECEQASFEAAQEAQWQQPGSETEPQIHRTEISTSPASNAPEVTSSPPQDVCAGGLQRRPSVVREDEQESKSDCEEEAPHNASAALDAVPVRHSIYTHGVPSPPQSENTDDQLIEMADPAPVELAVPSTASPEPTPTIQETQAVVPRPQEVQVPRRDSRTHSKSPVRSARFGTVQEAPIVKHEPPARSLSPRKSALKQASPSRGASPRGDRSESSGVDTPTQEPPVQRKKSVRVSFDDENTVVVGEAAGRGETDSPVPPSPQQAPGVGKRPWYNTLGIGRKKDVVPLEEDEVMKPRPALPSFGSVRERKLSPRPAEERPLVRPYEQPAGLSGPDVGEMALEAEAMGHSSDLAVGAIIQEQGPKNGANISKVREPLPPVVTSIEGNGYASDSAVSSDDDAVLLADTPRLEAEESQVSQASTLVPEQSKAPNGSAAAAAKSERSAIDVKDFGAVPVSKPDAVPVISITQPSPRPEQIEEERSSYIHFPGEFPETETETDGEHTPARQVTFEPVVQQEDATATSKTSGTALATQPAAPETTDDSDGSSIYSDAYEDLAEIEGDGFQSLDAVVETPMLKTPPRNVLERAEAQRAEAGTPTPQPRGVAAATTTTPQSGSTTTELADQDPWAAAKAYWRSLTAEKRAQLEKEAAEEAGTEADLEGAQSGARKPRRKKSVEQRNAEKKAIEEQRAHVDSNRTYMIKPGTKAGPAEYGTTAEAVEKGRPRPNGAKPDTGTRLRKTMRAAEAQPVDTGTRMRKSMRAAGAPGSTVPEQRLASHQPPGNTAEVTGARHHRAMPESMQPSLRRRGSDSSASSFKRARPASSGFGFRKTMRTGTGSFDSQESREQQPSRFSLRAMSPPGRGASPPVSMGTRMRTTLRGDPAARRSSEDSGKGYLRFSSTLGRPSDKKEKQRSRFGDDSSDEDGATPRRFMSRFEDSSDEDTMPAESLAPLSAQTMRGARGDKLPSPPLPEEEEMSDYEDARGDEHTHRITPGADTDTTLRRSRSGRALDSGRPSSRRSGFMSSVLRRSKKHDGGGKISRPEPKESAARRDTNLERSADELTALRSNGLRGQAAPRLHKRAGGNWPLNGDDEPKQPEESEEQMTTGHGATPDEKRGLEVLDEEGGDVMVAPAAPAAPRSPSVLAHARSQPSLGRPAFLMRRTMSAASGTVRTDDLGSDATGSGRKRKKFGALRRMFKLDE